MKRSAKPSKPQMNLPLLDVPATAIPSQKQKELALTLMEILISAVRTNETTSHTHGEKHEPTETHR
jgi:hypothetical protein